MSITATASKQSGGTKAPGVSERKERAKTGLQLHARKVENASCSYFSDFLIQSQAGQDCDEALSWVSS